MGFELMARIAAEEVKLLESQNLYEATRNEHALYSRHILQLRVGPCEASIFLSSFRSVAVAAPAAVLLLLLLPVVVAFSSRAKILGKCSTIHSPPALFCFFVFAFYFFFFSSFLEVEISPCTLIPLSRPGSVHSGSAS